MGKIPGVAMELKQYDNYLARYEGEDFTYRAVSVRQAWYLAFQHFGDECIDYLAEIDEQGEVVDVILDKEDVY